MCSSPDEFNKQNQGHSLQDGLKDKALNKFSWLWRANRKTFDAVVFCLRAYRLVFLLN